MVVYPERMRENLERSRGVVFSGTVLLELARRGVSREQAYEWVQRNAMRAFHEQRDFKALLLADADVTAVLPPAEIERAFDLDEQLKHVDHIFERVFVRAPAGRSRLRRRVDARARVRDPEAVGVRSAGHDRRRGAAHARLCRRRRTCGRASTSSSTSTRRAPTRRGGWPPRPPTSCWPTR